MKSEAGSPCTCNHPEKNPHVHPKAKYSWWAWGFLLFGISIKPLWVAYVCDQCQGVVRVDESPNQPVY